MDARIVKDIILDIIDRKIEILKERGVFVVKYDELLLRLNRMGYTEEEIRSAIVTLVRSKEIKAGKFADGEGWVRDYRNIDNANDIRPKQHS